MKKAAFAAILLCLVMFLTGCNGKAGTAGGTSEPAASALAPITDTSAGQSEAELSEAVSKTEVAEKTTKTNASGITQPGDECPPPIIRLENLSVLTQIKNNAEKLSESEFAELTENNPQYYHFDSREDAKQFVNEMSELYIPTLIGNGSDATPISVYTESGTADVLFIFSDGCSCSFECFLPNSVNLKYSKYPKDFEGSELVFNTKINGNQTELYYRSSIDRYDGNVFVDDKVILFSPKGSHDYEHIQTELSQFSYVKIGDVLK